MAEQQRNFVPAPGRCVVKMKPIMRGTGIKNALGEEIMKPDETVEKEQLRQNVGEVVSVGPPIRDGKYKYEAWFSEGDTVIVTRVGGTKMELGDGEIVQTYWLVPFDNVQGVFVPVEEVN